ncbi:hypothetical protein PMW_45 [Pseudomonas phage phiPMW]|uniref:Uncharacterized protein n=1 Tax=Pseudomonas phage phiPMW TaxID=1815582 RepID=A0A1S5R185_9CAUD|nr:hypothetical protein FDG97_gp045 [Pseudomonas phage phiPMW]ANA49170.1 hypothetical protein PMW_45 [Pseudomonas phage phiPMW]
MKNITRYEFKHISVNGDPVAWFVFYDDDGQLARVVYTREEAAQYERMAYTVHPVFGDPQNA